MKFILKHYGEILKECLLEEGQEYTIGRNKDCDFVLEEEPGLSRNHLKICQSSENGSWLIESLSELGGLYFEGEEIEGLELSGSCSLTLKNYVLEFVKEQTAEKESESPVEEPALEDKAMETNLDLSEKEPTGTDGRTRLVGSDDLVYSLHVYIDGEISDHISLNEEQNDWLIGRSEDCDISIDYSILTRKHLKISKQHGQFYVEDLGSSNKTFLNEKELDSHKKILLKPNDEISVSDLKMIFEVRKRKFDQMMSNLPAVPDEDPNEANSLPSVAMPKVVLEEIAEEETSSKPPQFFNKKRKIMIAVVLGLLALAGYFQYEEMKTDEKTQAEQQKDKEFESKMEVFYKDAIINQDKGMYQPCITQIEELHQMSPSGYYKDSQQILVHCQQALTNQKQKEEYQAREEMKKETEEKIKKIVEDCQTKYRDKKIQTEADLNQCAQELLGGLDPANAEISNIRMGIQEKANLKLMEEQKKEQFTKTLQAKRALYYKAKKRHDKGESLSAIKAYNAFLKSAKGFPALKSLYKKAKQARDDIQNKYDSQLASLHQSCQSLIQEKKMKEAYYDCQKVLSFKSDDEKAKQALITAEKALKDELKPIYEASVFNESSSQIDKAKELWQEILDKDIEGGYYYKKASRQIKKYE